MLERCSYLTAFSSEVITRGGEEEFVSELIEESLLLREQVTWYTSMLGKKSSVEGVLGSLHERGVNRATATEFKQGVIKWLNYLPILLYTSSIADILYIRHQYILHRYTSSTAG